jgi:hypothetical protein
VNESREPLDVSGVELAADVLAITEILARHVHDSWLRIRLAQGWTLGPQRDDRTRQHPCLVPYEDLPEDEKESDRQTTLATLRGLIALGYEIRRDRS